jgi:adenylyl-sulfate kinase
VIIWLTGIPASGKTTIAAALYGELIDRFNYSVEWLDGDDLRNSDFARGVGYSREERDAHVLRVGYLARALSHHVDYVICSLVSPYESVRNQAGIDVLVHVDCPVSVAMERDPKGLYRKAKAGLITNLTGYNAPYEPPQKPDVYLETSGISVKECVERILKAR